MDEVIKNRRVNYKIKHTPGSIDDMEVVLASYDEAIDRAQIIVDNLKDNPGWLALKKTYEEKIEEIDRILENFKDMPDKHVDCALSDKKNASEFANTVERFEKRIEKIEEDRAQLKAKIDERKQRLREPEPKF